MVNTHDPDYVKKVETHCARAEIAFKALDELEEALNPDKPKPVAVLRRILREARMQLEQT